MDPFGSLCTTGLVARCAYLVPLLGRRVAHIVLPSHCSMHTHTLLVQVWVLDALPGEVRSGERGGQDHPADLIAALQQLPMPIPNRSHLQNYLVQRGFSLQIARWASTNLRPLHGDHR